MSCDVSPEEKASLVEELQEIKSILNELQATGDGTLWGFVLWAITFVGLVAGVISLQKWLPGFLTILSKKTDTKIDDLAVVLFTLWLKLEFTIPLCGYVAGTVFSAGYYIDIASRSALIGVGAYKAVKTLDVLLGFVIKDYVGESEAKYNISHNVKKVASIVFYSLAVVFILDNLGFQMSTLVAGFGIGGLGVALAAQSVLGDAIASMSIFIDKPFEVGDVVSVAGVTGSVERIGLKTTRIRAVSGELIVIPNSTISESTIQNFNSTWSAQFIDIGISLRTPREQLRKVPEILHEGLVSPKFEVTEVIFKGRGEYALHFEIRYRIPSGAFREIRAALSEINFLVHDTLASHDIIMPLPCRISIPAANSNLF